MFQFAKFFFLVAFGSCCLGISVSSSNFPADIPRCHYGDIDCIKTTTTNLVRLHAKHGYPAVGFPVIEPFYIKSADLSDGRDSALNLKLYFTDLYVDGISGIRLDRLVGFERDPAKSKFEMYGSFPKITLRAKYRADGRILILPIQGNGDADIGLIHPKFSVKFKPSLHQKNGKSYMKVDKFKILVEPERMTLKLTNLFNGDAALGANLNQFMNENWQDVWNELSSSIHFTIAEVIKSIMGALFERFAYEDVFLDE